MSNPFRQPMPRSTDLRIRWRLFRAWLADHRAVSAAALLVPAAAVWMLVVGVGQTGMNVQNPEQLVAEIQQVQAAERARAADGIYHVTRRITEGADKPAFVKTVTGEVVLSEPRVDFVETYQHNDTALALVESNGTERPFEAFLSREHDDGQLSLHHYGPARRLVSADRAPYDEAHDLASLYTGYTSLERPEIPTLAPEAEFVAIDEATNQARFRTTINEAIIIDSFVDLTTKHVVEEVIYVRAESDEYEMTRITYLAREILPASDFEQVFDPTQFDYEVIATADAVS